MHKLDLEKTEEQDIKLPMHIESQKSQENSRKKIYFCLIDYTKAFDCVDQNKMWKILQEMGIPDHLTCLLRNLYAGQEVKLELDMEQQTGSKWEKEYVKAVRLLLFSPGSWCTQGFVCALQESVSLVLCKFCNQIPLASKDKF